MTSPIQLWRYDRRTRSAVTRRARLTKYGGFYPTQVSAVSAWLRLAAGTVTGSGYSSVPDLLASNPATQSTDALRPPSLTSANGLPVADYQNSDYLIWPSASGNNGATFAGFALWIRPDSAIVTGGIVGRLSGATNRFEILQVNTDVAVNVFHSQFIARRGTASAVLTAGAWQFLTWEYDGSQATDATKCVITLNGVVQTLAFVDDAGAPGAMPSTLVTGTADMAIGARRVSDGLTPYDGRQGPNIFALGSKMAGATTGLLTTAARTALMNFEAPT